LRRGPPRSRARVRLVPPELSGEAGREGGNERQAREWGGKPHRPRMPRSGLLHLTGALVQREEGAESESGLRKSADGKSDRLPLGGLAVRVVVPASECRGGVVAARPAKVSPQKDQEKRVFSASSAVASPVTLDGLPASGDGSCEAAAWQQSFVFQVSEREPALRVTYPPPFNVVAAFAASSAPAKPERSVWWPLAVLIRTHYDAHFATVVREKQLLRPGDLPGMASGV